MIYPILANLCVLNDNRVEQDHKGVLEVREPQDRKAEEDSGERLVQTD